MGRGGKREGAGRPSGARNTVTADLREAAGEYTPEALETLRSICKSGASESARVAAASAILDRAYDKLPWRRGARDRRVAPGPPGVRRWSDPRTR
jgi:hypothetical protein